MQSMLIPMGFCSKIENTIRNFLYGGRDDQSSINLANWEMIVKKIEWRVGIAKSPCHELSFFGKARMENVAR